MNKCYVFAIGGTGERVLRALTMLLAGGVRMGEIKEIVPIIIDPDTAGGDLTRVVRIMECYESLREYVKHGYEDRIFFNTAINKLFPQGYSMLVENTSDMTFREFIDVSTMSRENLALAKMLFSERNLDSSMKIGFKGNPNIGCVVLNQIAQSEGFASFANSFAEGDKIFIISSIFGGTGASGFPLLLKTLRTGQDFPNHSIINNAEIGAITVLPYFRVRNSKKSEIDSSTFVSKAVAALGYYENNIYRDRLVNALYFAGDDMANVYDNNEGGREQQNEAHLIEFIAATAVVDFCNNHYRPTQNLELGIKDVKGDVRLDSFHKGIKDMVASPLTRLYLMSECLSEKFDFLRSPHFNASNILKLKSGFFEGAFMRNLMNFTMLYTEWLEEMKENVRSLYLFKPRNGGSPFDIIPGVAEKKVHSLKNGYYLFYDRLNRAAFGMKSSKSMETDFLRMFYEATGKLMKEKINL